MKIRSNRHVLVRVALLAAAVLVLSSSLVHAQADNDFYRGKTLEVIVPFSTGGGTDTWARIIAPYLQQELGERASVQVVNIPGASSVKGANEFALRRRPDGMTTFVSSGSTVLPYLLGEPAVKYEFRDFTAILASPVGGVVYGSSELGISEAEDLCNIDQQLTYGGISATGNDLVPLISFELLEIDTETILGYGGRGPARVAFEQGETNIDYQTTPAYLANVQPLADAGKAVPLYSFGILDDQGQVITDPVFPDLPTVRDVYETCHGEAPSGAAWDAYRAALAAGFAVQKVFWIHDLAPEGAKASLLDAAERMVDKPEFKEVARREVGDYEFYTGREAQSAFSAASDISEEALDWLKGLLRDKYDVDRL
jgi:tripartite-type tricarboxylate transporter receptor subunit TctC